MVAYGGTLQLSLYKDGTGLPPQGRTVRAGATLPPVAPASFFPGRFPVPCNASRGCACCGYVFAALVACVAVEYGCLNLFRSSLLLNPCPDAAALRPQSFALGVSAGPGRERDRLGQRRSGAPGPQNMPAYFTYSHFVIA